jgi:uncharacterized membrane protein YqjE
VLEPVLLLVLELLVLELAVAVAVLVLVLVLVLAVLALVPAKRLNPDHIRTSVAFQEPISASWTRTAQQHQACGVRHG